MHRGDLTNEQWARLAPLLPPQKPKTGRTNLDHRRIINGILWILRTGAPWEDLPERYGTRGTVSSRYYRWRKAGIWDRIFADLQAQADADGALDWTIHFVDSTIVRAHQHAAGAKKGIPKPKRSGGVRAASQPN
jgi:transposase